MSSSANISCAKLSAGAAWLAPPTGWRWPPQLDTAVDSLQNLETLFLPPPDSRDDAAGGGVGKGATDGMLHWLRPGMLAFAAVSRAGELQVTCFRQYLLLDPRKFPSPAGTTAPHGTQGIGQ